MKSPTMSPPRIYPIPNQDINILITQQYPSLPPIKAKYTTGYNPIFNDTHDPNYSEDDFDGSTNNSSNENKYSVNKLKVNNSEDNDEE